MTEAPDYRDTIFLPQSTFPMRAGLPDREPAWLKHWEEIGIYDRLREKKGRTPFILHDGPPYANGHLHIGHALNKILKDMVVRSQQMMGKDARYVPGWDCHGLPIEWKIEEKYRDKGQDKDEVDVIAFRQECRKFAESWIDIQRDEFKRLGVTGAWDKPYKTMDYHAESVISQEFMKLIMDGSLYQGSKPVMWSPVEKTALAEAEVEYHDHTSHMIWVRFAPNATSKSNLDGTSVVIWTTTPWTIPQNRAVAYNPDIAYSIYQVDSTAENSTARIGEKLVLADALSEAVMKAAKVDSFTRLREVTSDELATATLAHPYHKAEQANGEWSYDIPMLAAEHVTEDAGTGFVHTAPSHGDDDYQLGLKHGLKMTYNVAPDGSYRKDLPLFGGEYIITADGKEGSANVSNIKQLAYAGALLAKGKLKHSYPHSWRSKAPLIYRNTPQWFVAIDKPLADGMGQYGDTIRERALSSIRELVTFTPVSGKNRLQSMIETRPDWVLSRQRAWGVPLSCFTKKGALPTDPDFILRNDTLNDRIVAAFQAEGADAWYQEGFKEKILRGIANPDDYEQVFDILDVWFDSGSTHAFVLRDRDDGVKDGIADLYLEGTDQHRGWFHSSLLQASATKGRAPYRGVLTHGFTLDEKGMKMSKSLGNTVAPQEVIKEYGADILRLWVASSDYSADLRIGKEILKGVSDSYRRLRNTMRFMLGALSGWSESERLELKDMPELDAWVLHRLARLNEEVRKDYETYDFQGVFQKIFSFCTSDLSSFYFDIRKDVLYCDTAHSLKRRATRTVLDHLFFHLTSWLAPILVFTAEDIWQARFGQKPQSIHLHDFPDTPKEWRNDALARKWEHVRAARRVVNGILERERTAKVIGSSLEADPTLYVSDPELYNLLSSVDMAEICLTSDISLTSEPAPKDAFKLDDHPALAVTFSKAPGKKCARCWKIRPDVGSYPHTETCQRCNDALNHI